MPNGVSVLLSTYNGAQYLPQLLNSLVSQTYPDVLLNIRDDGSTDETCEILRMFATGRSNVRMMRGTRLGPALSFLELLRNTDFDCQFFAFCDQDDVWLPKKLEDAIRLLQQYSPEEPLMYCSAVEYVDSNLRHLGYSKPLRRLGFANALVENVATGCTQVMNRRARDLIVENMPSRPLMHDWWCYLVVSALGRVIYGDKPQVKYRQHASNTMGARKGLLHATKIRLTRLLCRNLGFTEQASDFHQLFRDELKEEDRKMLQEFLEARNGFSRRVRCAARVGVRRQSKIDGALLRLLIVARLV
jgi:glycosyltransferase involved in cell wall biosynthesis